MKWTDLQDSIAQRYCGTVLVLDDEIEVRPQSGNSVQISPIFVNAKRAFEDKGMLCDLRHIEDDFDKSDRLNLLQKQWRRSDTVMLDWYLGTGKQELKDPSNALKVLRDLAENGGFRFAVIQSKEDPEQILACLRAEFPACKTMLATPASDVTADDDHSEVVSEEGQVSLPGVAEPPAVDKPAPTAESPQQTPSAESPQQAPSTYRLSSSLYVSVVAKDKNPMAVVDVPYFFACGLKQAFPDHLHWVGFDFATRVRELLPNVLAVLPSGTDVAIVFQALLQGDDELGDSLVECLADEIRELLRGSPLDSASDETIVGRLIEAAQERLPSEEWKQAVPKNVKQACNYVHSIDVRQKAAFIKYFGDYDGKLDKDRKVVQAALSKAVAKALGFDSDSAGSDKLHDSFGSLREHYHAATESRLYPGVVLKRTPPIAGGRNWLLCLSPACDCARGDKNQDYLFVEGKELGGPEPDKVNSAQTCLSVDGRIVHVQWSSKWFKTINTPPSKVEGYEFRSRLRDDFVHLLVQRVFGWQSRVGVNTSEFLRVRRDRL